MNEKKVIPIGYENFKKIIDNDLYYVDKTMLIYKILRNKEENLLFTRPRRFGKTLNISMLRYFFDINEKENAYLFDGLKISEHYEEVKKYRNAFPVISLTLKDAKQNSFEESMKIIKYVIREQFVKNSFLINSDSVQEENKVKYRKILNSDIDADWGTSLKLLTLCMKQHYGEDSIILIDEYDVPLESSYLNGYYDEMIGFIRTLFSSTLKTNDNLKLSVITGCLRVSKESVFTGLNNFKVGSIDVMKYSDGFGFTPDEVKEILKYYEIEEKEEEIKHWYDGYVFGRQEIYNPWSVLNQIDTWINEDYDDMPQPWWINTSGNDILQVLIKNSDRESKDIIENLIKGGSVETYINQTVTYGDLAENPDNIWSFLYFTGYLKAISYKMEDRKKKYTMVIPNLEVRECYKDTIMMYFDRLSRSTDKEKLYKLLLSGKAEEFAECVTKVLKETISFYDTAENFYHGFLAGLLSQHPDFKVKSNRENGDGRTDLTLVQRDGYKYAIILEFKVCGKGEMEEEAAERALKQINDRHYDEEVREDGYREVLKYGIAFCGKACYAVGE